MRLFGWKTRDYGMAEFGVHAQMGWNGPLMAYRYGGERRRRSTCASPRLRVAGKVTGEQRQSRRAGEDGFSYVPAFWATIACMLVGLYLLAGGIAASDPHAAQARKALVIGCVLALIVGAFLIFQHIANDG